MYDPKLKQGCLSVTFINGFLNVIRCQIKDKGTLLSADEYYEKLKGINIEKLKEYKSSQYNKMGRTIYLIRQKKQIANNPQPRRQLTNVKGNFTVGQERKRRL